MRVGAHEQAVAAHAALLQRVDLLEQRLRVDDDAVADDGGDVRGEHTGREDVQCVLLLADHDRVAGVVAALVPDDVLHASPSRSVALPLPSSPHWAPISTMAGILFTPFTRRKPLAAQARQGLLRCEVTRNTQVKPSRASRPGSGPNADPRSRSHAIRARCPRPWRAGPNPSNPPPWSGSSNASDCASRSCGRGWPGGSPATGPSHPRWPPPSGPAT